MATQDKCRLCDKVMTSDESTITRKGLDTILRISSQLKNGIDIRLVLEQPPIPARKSGKTYYKKTVRL